MNTPLTDSQYMLFDVEDGAESVGFPLPVETKATGSRMLLLWQVRGVRIRDPKPSWTQKHLAYLVEHYPDTPRLGATSDLSAK